MIGNRDAYIRAELEHYRAVLWAYEHRAEALAADTVLALRLVQDGAGVSEEAARAFLDPDLDLASWGEDEARRLRRAIADDEAWLASPAGTLHPAMARALAPTLADLQRTDGPRFRFEHEPVDPGCNPMVVAHATDGTGTGVWVDAFGDDADNVDSVTDQMYEPALEASDGQWPSCPIHLEAHRLVLYRGGWKCLITGEHVAEVGALGE